MIDILDKAKDKGIIQDEVADENVQNKEKVKQYDSDDYITVYSLRHGTLRLKSNENMGRQSYETYKFDGYMDSQQVRVALLQDLVRQNDRIFELGWIYIPNEDVKKQLRIDQLINEDLLPNKIDKILESKNSRVIEFIDDLDKSSRKTFRDIVVGKIVDKELNDYNLINLLKDKLKIALKEDIR